MGHSPVFSCARPEWQGWLGFKQCISSSSEPSTASANAQLLKEFTIMSLLCPLGGGGGGAYLKLGANSSIYRTCLPALGTGQAVGWSRVFYLLLSLPYWIYWHKHRQKCWPAFPSAIRWCHIVQRMPCKGVCRISLTRAHSLGFAHACCSCNALRPLTINLAVVIWIFSVIVIRDHF